MRDLIPPLAIAGIFIFIFGWLLISEMQAISSGAPLRDCIVYVMCGLR